MVSLTARRLAALPPDPRPLPSVAAYDQLLRHTRPAVERPTSQGSPAMNATRPRGLAEPAADAAIDAACRKKSAPAHDGGQFGELPDAAAREQMPTAGSWPSC